MISGPEIIRAVTDEVERRLRADCYLFPHMTHDKFNLNGGLELELTLTGERQSVHTTVEIRLDSVAQGRQLVQREAVFSSEVKFGISPTLREAQQKPAQPPRVVQAEAPGDVGGQDALLRQPVPSQPTRQPVRVPSPADVASCNRLANVIRERPGSSSNEIFGHSGLGRSKALQLLKAGAGTLWRVVEEGQRRSYYPLPSGNSPP